MTQNFKLSKKSMTIMALAFIVVGLIFMIVIDVQSARAEESKSIRYEAPSAGMSAVVTDYVAGSGEKTMSLLSTTAVGAGMENNNEYYDESGDYVGKLIVCTAEDYSPVYMVKSTSSGEFGKIYKDCVATVISVDGEWAKVVSGSVSGYVEKNDFAFGKEAEALDDQTYVTQAIINSDELTLREEPSMMSTALCILPSDSKHEVIEEDDGSGWTKVSVERVGEGYVMSEYLLVKDSHKYGTTLDAEVANYNMLSAGVEEAEAREEQWLEERLAREAEEARIAAEEEARRQAEAEAEEARRQAESSKNTSTPAVSGSSDDSYSDGSSDYSDSYNDSDDYSSNYSEPSYDPNADIRQQLVNYACSFAGWLPYVSGGASLSTGADCSGFTSQIYAAFGYSIPRGSDAQSYCGRSVSLSEALPGDILVYSGHVALYVGDGLKVHSPYPGQVVTVNSMYNMTLLDIRRVIE